MPLLSVASSHHFPTSEVNRIATPPQCHYGRFRTPPFPLFGCPWRPNERRLWLLKALGGILSNLGRRLLDMDCKKDLSRVITGATSTEVSAVLCTRTKRLLETWVTSQTEPCIMISCAAILAGHRSGRSWLGKVKKKKRALALKTESSALASSFA